MTKTNLLLVLAISVLLAVGAGGLVVYSGRNTGKEPNPQTGTPIKPRIDGGPMPLSQEALEKLTSQVVTKKGAFDSQKRGLITTYKEIVKGPVIEELAKEKDFGFLGKAVDNWDESDWTTATDRLAKVVTAAQNRGGPLTIPGPNALNGLEPLTTLIVPRREESFYVDGTGVDKVHFAWVSLDDAGKSGFWISTKELKDKPASELKIEDQKVDNLLTCRMPKENEWKAANRAQKANGKLGIEGLDGGYGEWVNDGTTERDWKVIGNAAQDNNSNLGFEEKAMSKEDRATRRKELAAKPDQLDESAVVGKLQALDNDTELALRKKLRINNMSNLQWIGDLKISDDVRKERRKEAARELSEIMRSKVNSERSPEEDAFHRWVVVPTSSSAKATP